MSKIFHRRSRLADIGVDTINPAKAHGNVTLPEQSAPTTEIPFNFAQQSIIQAVPTTLDQYQYAIFPQPVNQPIVPSTLQTKQNVGYAIALAPDSECPVALIFRAGAQRLTSTALTITPGQIIRPHGLPRNLDADAGSFSGFDFGLPFGWLGGGVGRLLVFKTEDSLLRYIGGGAHELRIHTITQPILAAASHASGPNWPKNFPWLNAKSELDANGAASATATVINQGAPAKIATRPSHVTLELVCNAAGLAVPASIDIYVYYNGSTIPIYDQVTFPSCPAGSNSYVDVGSPGAGGALIDFAGEDTVVCFASTDGTLQTYGINCYRYGTLT